MMGSGKTTAGRMLANVLKYCFFDSDTVIEQAVGGASITDIFASNGESGFRDMEQAVLSELCSYRNCVIATGGGVVARCGTLPETPKQQVSCSCQHDLSQPDLHCCSFQVYHVYDHNMLAPRASWSCLVSSLHPDRGELFTPVDPPQPLPHICQCRFRICAVVHLSARLPWLKLLESVVYCVCAVPLPQTPA